MQSNGGRATRTPRRPFGLTRPSGVRRLIQHRGDDPGIRALVSAAIIMWAAVGLMYGLGWLFDLLLGR